MKANEYWEHNIKGSKDSFKHIKGDVLWRFIKKKYIHKAFANKSLLDPIILYYEHKEIKEYNNELKATDCIKKYATLSNKDEVAEETDEKLKSLMIARIFNIGRNVLTLPHRRITIPN